MLAGYISSRWGWREAFLVAGLPGLAIALLCLWLRDPPRGRFDATQQPHADAATAPAADAQVRVTAQQDGDLLITVRDHLRAHSDAHAYVLVAAPQEKPMQTKLVVARAQEPVVTAPQGGSGGMVLQLENADYDAGLALFLQGLPAGVTAQFGAIKKGQNTVPLVIAAAQDAPIGASLADVRARAEKEPIERSAGYAQVLPLVTVRNDQPIWTATETRMPISVAAAAPFSITVRAPSVPIVRGAPLLVPETMSRKLDDGRA
jgi:hypothetical protein